MMDHVLSFPSEAAAHAALDQLGYGGTDPDTGQPYWDGSRMIVGQRVGTPDTVTGEGEDQTVTPGVVLPGFWLTIARDEVDPVITAVNKCWFVADREASAEGAPVFAYMAPDADPVMLATYTVSPVFAGSNYTRSV